MHSPAERTPAGSEDTSKGERPFHRTVNRSSITTFSG
jgi:hypothetical protein